MNGATITLTQTIASVPLTTQISGVADLDGDHKDDIMLRDTTASGVVSGWLMNGVQIKQQGTIYAGLSSDWAIQRVGDLDGDGKADIVFRSTSAGDVTAWLMNGLSIKQWGTTYTGLPSEWVIQQIGDLDGDGKSDLIFRNTSTGDVAGWLMNGIGLKQGGIIYSGLPAAWSIQAGAGLSRCLFIAESGNNQTGVSVTPTSSWAISTTPLHAMYFGTTSRRLSTQTQ
jgi:hypothetical protein